MELKKLKSLVSRLETLNKVTQNCIVSRTKEFFKERNAYRVEEGLKQWETFLREQNTPSELSSNLANIYLQRYVPAEIKALQMMLVRLASTNFFSKMNNPRILDLQSKLGSTSIATASFLAHLSSITSEYAESLEIDCIESQTDFSHIHRYLLKSFLAYHDEQHLPGERHLQITGYRKNIKIITRIQQKEVSQKLYLPEEFYDIVITNHVIDYSPIVQGRTSRVRALQLAKRIAKLVKKTLKPNGFWIIIAPESRYRNLVSNYLISLAVKELNVYYPCSPHANSNYLFWDEHFGYFNASELVDLIPRNLLYPKRLLSKTIMIPPTIRQLRQSALILSRNPISFLDSIWFEGFQGAGGFGKIVSLPQDDFPEIKILKGFNPTSKPSANWNVGKLSVEPEEIFKQSFIGDLVFIWNQKGSVGEQQTMSKGQKAFNISHAMRLNYRNCDGYLGELSADRHRLDLIIDNPEQREMEQLSEASFGESELEFY